MNFYINEDLRVSKIHNYYMDRDFYTIQKYRINYRNLCLEWDDIYNIGDIEDVKKLKEICEKILDNTEE